MKQVVIYVPGLNDTRFINNFLTQFLPLIWKAYDFETILFSPKWGNGKFDIKLQSLLTLIDNLHKEKKEIYLIGQSGGGSFVLNAFTLRTSFVQGVVNINGRTKKGENVFPSLALAAKNNEAFKESVLQFENVSSKKLTSKDKRKILMVRPIIDKIVPESTFRLEGVAIRIMPISGHMLGGIFACTLFSPIIFRFLNRENNI